MESGNPDLLLARSQVSLPNQTPIREGNKKAHASSQKHLANLQS